MKLGSNIDSLEPMNPGLATRIKSYYSKFGLRGATSIGRFTLGKAMISNRGVIDIGENCTICDVFPRFELPQLTTGTGGRIRLGNDCVLNYGVIVAAWDCVEIGRNVNIGMYCLISDTGFANVGARKPPVSPRPIKIGDNVWLAARVVVNPGVTIGDGTIVAAGSFVATDLPAGVMAGGNPARVFGSSGSS